MWGNRFVDKLAGQYAEQADAFSIYRNHFNRTDRLIKSVIRRLVAINEHCMKNYSYKKEKREPKERLAVTLDNLIRRSEHEIELVGLKWECKHCLFRSTSKGLRRFLKKYPECKNPPRRFRG